MKVLVVTEIRLYRDGVAEALRRLLDVEQAATAATGAAAVVTARRTDCNVVLIDMSMTDSAATVQALLAARPSIKVVALGVPDEGPEVVACAELGIAGYVPREASLEELGDALRCALRGDAPCSSKVAASLIRHIALQARSRPMDGRPMQLTRRERDVVRLLESGLTNKEISSALDIQLSTVKNHVHNLLAKFGASGRAEVVGALHRAGRTSPPV